MAVENRTVLRFEGEGASTVLRVIDMGERGLCFTTDDGFAPKGVTLDGPYLDALERFIARWRGRGVA